MNIWRPSPSIVVKSLGLHWRSQSLLAVEVLNDAGDIKGVRPLGGTVEFGETWREALLREFKEELEIEVTLSGKPLIMENIYSHEGVDGHEIVFISEVLFPAGVYESMDKVIFAEASGQICTARWFSLADLDNGGVELYPTGLKNRLLTSDHG